MIVGVGNVTTEWECQCQYQGPGQVTTSRTKNRIRLLENSDKEVTLVPTRHIVLETNVFSCDSLHARLEKEIWGISLVSI